MAPSSFKWILLGIDCESCFDLQVCFKGTNVFKGYYKNPEKTEEAIDTDGWLHSGDIGRWLPNGTLKIIDRKKHIFKLSQVQ